MRKSVYQPIKKGEYWIGTNCFGVVHSEIGIDVVLRHWTDPTLMARFSKRDLRNQYIWRRCKYQRMVQLIYG